MFMSFKCCDINGPPQGQRVCINMRKIENIMEMGQWTHMPLIEGDPYENLYRPERRAMARARQPDVFVVTPGCVSIRTVQDTYFVMANYGELAKTLESLNNMYESL